MQFSKAIAYTIGKSNKMEKSIETPGMGQYNPREKSTKKKAPDYG